MSPAFVSGSLLCADSIKAMPLMVLKMSCKYFCYCFQYQTDYDRKEISKFTLNDLKRPKQFTIWSNWYEQRQQKEANDFAILKLNVAVYHGFANFQFSLEIYFEIYGFAR